MQLELNALFSQAVKGDAKAKDFEQIPEVHRGWAIQNHEAWEAKRGMSFQDAKKAYIDLAAQVK